MDRNYHLKILTYILKNYKKNSHIDYPQAMCLVFGDLINKYLDVEKNSRKYQYKHELVTCIEDIFKASFMFQKLMTYTKKKDDTSLLNAINKILQILLLDNLPKQQSLNIENLLNAIEKYINKNQLT